MSNVMALVHFVKEGTTDILNVENIPEDARFVGSVSEQVKWKHTNQNTAKVLMISENKDELDRAEDNFHSELDKQKDVSQKNKRTRRPNAKYVGNVASDKEVALALHERPKLSKDHQKEKVALNKSKKKLKQSHDSAQVKMDENILGMMGQNTGEETPVETTSSADDPATLTRSGPVPHNSTSKSAARVLFENENATDDDVEETGASDAQHIGQKYEADSPSQFQRLKNLANPSTRALVTVLAEILQVAVPKEKSEVSAVEYIEVLPPTPGEQVAELTSKMGVFISARLKNKIKTDHAGDPNKMIADLLQALFSKSILQSTHVTARGNTSGSKGIRKNVLDAMLAFVNRHTPNPAKKLKEATFIRQVNRQSDYWREAAASQKRRRPEKSAEPSNASTFSTTSVGTSSSRKSTASIPSAAASSAVGTRTPTRRIGRSPLPFSPSKQVSDVARLDSNSAPADIVCSPSKYKKGGWIVTTTPKKTTPCKSVVSLSPSCLPPPPSAKQVTTPVKITSQQATASNQGTAVHAPVGTHHETPAHPMPPPPNQAFLPPQPPTPASYLATNHPYANYAPPPPQGSYYNNQLYPPYCPPPPTHPNRQHYGYPPYQPYPSTPSNNSYQNHPTQDQYYQNQSISEHSDLSFQEL